jgi:hypothetical protein
VELERRRMLAARLLEKGYTQSEVARRVGAHRQSVSRWAAQLESEGRGGLKRAGRAGRKPRLSGQDWEKIERGLKRGPEALAGGAPDRGGMWGPLPCLAGLAQPATAGMELSASHRPGPGPG